MTAGPRRLALFDLDRTLIAENSGTLWLWQEIRERRVGAKDALRAAWFAAQYSLGFVELERGVREIIATLEGEDEAELDRRVERFFQRVVRPLYRPGAAAVLAEHRRAGHPLALVTSASIYLAERVAADLGLEHVVASRFEVEAGRFTGRPAGEVCFGPGKLELARRMVATLGGELAECSFYSDSLADLPLLEAVGEPVVVHPDPRLLRVARARGWRIADWGSPRARVPSGLP